MASVQHYIEDAEQLIPEILQRTRIADLEKFTKYKHALTIQRHFRGYIQRKHLAFLHRQATIIQKYIRLYLVRKKMVHILCSFTQYLYAREYNHRAVLIQKHWRGYYVRSNIFSYYAFKNWLRFVANQNECMRHLIKVQREKDIKQYDSVIEAESQQWVMFILFKLHHLLSTAATKGIYGPKTEGKHLPYVEELLHSLKYSDYMKSLRQHYKQLLKKNQPRKTILRGRLAKCERYWIERNLNEYQDPKAGPGVYPYLKDYKNSQGQRFILSTRFSYHDKYDLGPYKDPVELILRDIDRSKDISKNVFNCYCVKLKPFHENLDYYVNMWDNMVLCEEHYVHSPYSRTNKVCLELHVPEQ